MSSHSGDIRKAHDRIDKLEKEIAALKRQMMQLQSQINITRSRMLYA